MRQQHIERNKAKPTPQVVDERRPQIPEGPAVDPAIANQPLRTVFYMEVGDMAPAQVQLLIQHVNEMYSTARGGIHYVIPMRHGKIGSDVMFEKEFMKVVGQMCEVKDGEIVLKAEAKDATIIRHKI